MMPLTKAQSDAAFEAAHEFISDEIDNSGDVPSMFVGPADRGLETYAAKVRAMADKIGAAVLAAS
jgi:hypothetical protein